MRIYSLWHRQGVSLLAARRHIRSPRGLHIPRKRSEEIKYGTDLIPSFYGWSRGASGPSSLCGCCEWMEGWRGNGWAGRKEHHSRRSLHQHPHADHVSAHVSDNAAGSYGPGWALRWRTERNYMLPERDAARLRVRRRERNVGKGPDIVHRCS